MFERPGTGVEGVELGSSSRNNVLVQAVVGVDQPRRSGDGSALLVDAGDGRKRWSKAVADVRSYLGHCGAHQSIITGFSARFRVVDMVSTLEGRQTFSGWNRSGLRYIPRLHCAVANSQLPYVRTSCVSTFELWCGTPHR